MEDDVKTAIVRAMKETTPEEEAARHQEDIAEAEKRLALGDDEKLAIAEEYLTTHHLEIWGGYPSASRWDGDTFIWVDSDGKSGDIHMARRSDLLEWVNEALADDLEILRKGYNDTSEIWLYDIPG